MSMTADTAMRTGRARWAALAMAKKKIVEGNVEIC